MKYYFNFKKKEFEICMVTLPRFELGLFALKGRRVNQFHYSAICIVTLRSVNLHLLYPHLVQWRSGFTADIPHRFIPFPFRSSQSQMSTANTNSYFFISLCKALVATLALIYIPSLRIVGRLSYLLPRLPTLSVYSRNSWP